MRGSSQHYQLSPDHSQDTKRSVVHPSLGGWIGLASIELENENENELHTMTKSN